MRWPVKSSVAAQVVPWSVHATSTVDDVTLITGLTVPKAEGETDRLPTGPVAANTRPVSDS